MYTRTNPYLARIKSREKLSGPGSSKKTYHVVLEIEQEEITFNIGDSIGVIPQNHPELVEKIIKKLGADGNEQVYCKRTDRELPFREYLLTRANLQKCSFHKLFPVEKTSKPLIELIDAHQPHPSELARVLLPLLPRFYSIASSLKVFPNEVHLLIAHVEYQIDGELQYGVGSHFLCKQAEVALTPIPIYVQPSNHFTLPSDPTTPIVMIGPGTGVAPFRAFLQERLATQSEGRNWLFFGECNEKTDFYYQDYWEELEKLGRIRLSTAFSRDQEEKMYVQHRMWEERKSLWEWIEEGALIYVCGDANQMAKDVDLTLERIIHTEGKLPEEDARIFLREMRKAKRYLLDVY